MRYLIAVGFACAIALAFAANTPAEAAKKFKFNQCTAKSIAGANVTWKCELAQKCCYSALTNQTSCVPSTSICL